MKFKDMIKMTHKHQGRITEVTHHFDDYYTVKVEVDQGMNWVAGEFAAFALKGNVIKGRKSRVFSIASIPADGYVLLGFRTGKTPSAFKQYIIDHGKGQEIEIHGPMGDFTLRNDNRPIVMFAGGVGITPIFSLLKSIGSSKARSVHVVYPSAQNHLFKDEIDKIAQSNAKIHVTYLHKAEEAQAKMTELAQKFGNDAYYYTAGSGSAIMSIRNLLKAQKISERNMLNDHFHGYR